jgi:hypothetical protein
MKVILKEWDVGGIENYGTTGIYGIREYYGRYCGSFMTSGPGLLVLFSTTTMDDSVRPPVRLQAISSTGLSTKSVKARVDEFMADFQNRSTPAKGGDTTATAQLQKLSDALQQKLDRRKNGGGAWYVIDLKNHAYAKFRCKEITPFPHQITFPTCYSHSTTYRTAS